jgi:protein TonB
MKRLDFEAQGEKLATLAPVFMGLGKLRAAKGERGGRRAESPAEIRHETSSEMPLIAFLRRAHLRVAGLLTVLGRGGVWRRSSRPLRPLFRRGGLLGIVLVLHGVAMALKPTASVRLEKPLMVHFIEPSPKSLEIAELAPEPLPVAALPPPPALSPPEPLPEPKPEPPTPRPKPKPVPQPEPASPPLETTESSAPAPDGAIVAALPEPAPAPRSENTASAATAGRGDGEESAIVARFDAGYLRNPKPPYPPQSRRLGEEGKVVLRALVSQDGEALEVQLHASSGSGRLDESALKTVRQWKFIPARRAGVAVESWALVPILFKLEH